MTTLPDWNEATRAQITAARPDTSTWLSANAGSGKTRVLTDRVARLLLDRVEPQHILCLTYTKAAASEMQNRLFKRLGEWAMMDDHALSAELRDLGVLAEISAPDLSRARTLFAQAIETPGGLKIQTIHSFCAALLRRFPLEAGVSPQFKEIEDRAAELLRADIVDRMADGPQAALIADLARHYTGEDFAQLTRDITGKRDLFSGSELPDLNAVFALPADFDAAALPRQVMDEAVARWMPEALEILKAQSGVKMINLAKALGGIDFADPTARDLKALTDALLTKEGNLPKSLLSKDAKAKMGPMVTAFEDLMQRTKDAREAALAHRNVERSGALHRFARAFIAAYEAEKQRRGWLDFDDLILRARALLTDPKVAAWVLYRIDGGIDHILVDEAQDTSPLQWEVIARLADEFTSGEGARTPGERTLFVVGDKKQSIYSFQGADPREFDLKRDVFRDSLTAAKLPFQNLSLDYSFRSSPAVLRAVDRTFNTDPVPRMSEPMIHLAFKDSLPGRVDLWPHIPPEAEDDPESDWSDPVDRKGKRHHTVILAEQIATRIKHLIETENYIPDEGPDRQMIRRRIRAGDFLILVRGRKTGLFEHIIRACKAAKLPIAGADRLKVGAELAVRDIGALLSFLATPDDNLSLATALRSPLIGWSEQELYTLAQGRDAAQLWQVLRTQEERHPETLALLRDLRGQVDFLRPYDLIERLLTRHDGRRRILARLGSEAEDGIDALLSQALAYEQTEVPSLTGFLEWMQADDIEIKRQIDSASNQIRVMTVHGAKGLEAPIVILPDTAGQRNDLKGDILDVEGTGIWRPSKADTPEGLVPTLDAQKALQQEEKLRLLYVAMTRAEKWLIVAAAGKFYANSPSWYEMVEEAMTHLGAVSVEEPYADALRHQEPGWDDLPVHDLPIPARVTPVLDPVFSEAPPPAPTRTETLSPSDMGGAKALPGDAGRDEDAAKAYGSAVHLLLEHLAALPRDRHAQAAEALLPKLDPTIRAEALGEAIAVLDSPALAALFAPETLAEVPITATLADQPLYGIIDRLIITPERVLAVDFKTNRVLPDTPDAVPEALLRQMGAYARALGAVYPDRQIDTAILWTHRAELMEIPRKVTDAALDRWAHLDAGQPRS